MAEEYKDMSEAIASDLVACKKVFDSVGIPWVIMGGVVLGYARYNEVMPWDTDLDIGIFVEITDTQWLSIIHTLRDNGFRKIIIQKVDFTYCYRETELNLWMFHKNGNYYEAFPSTTPGLKFIEKAIWYDKPQMIDFLDSKYPMPNNMEDYLACQYGSDWEDNVVKNHEQYYLDKRGTRHVHLWPSGRGAKGGDMWPKVLKIEDTMNGS